MSRKRCKYHVCDEDDHERTDWKAHRNLDGEDAQYPGMATAFEAHYGQSWTDPNWRKEATKRRENAMNWNLTTAVENSLESVAREEALLSQEAHSYLPTTPEEAARFNPHEWVRESMRRAYVMGRADGATKARAGIRAALGVRE